MVALLLEHRALVDCRRRNGRTPLMDACDAGMTAVVQSLCDGGANVHLRVRRWLSIPRPLGCPLTVTGCLLLAGPPLTQRPMDRDSPPQDALDGVSAMHYAERCAKHVEALPGEQLSGHRRDAAGASADGVAAADGAGCIRVLKAFGARPGAFTRSEWFESALDDLDNLPSEYIVGFH
jgi:hypothetical protein